MAQPVNKREWLAVIADFRRSGFTQVDFCRRRGISVGALRYRLYHRLAPATDSSVASSAPRASTSATSLSSQFLPVHVRSGPITPIRRELSQSPASLELVVGDDQVVRIPVGFDTATLGRLLDLLENRS